MGEMAEYLLNGDDCQFCGEYLGEGDGYPRACYGCEQESRKEQKEKNILTTIENFSKFLTKNEKMIKANMAPHGSRLIKAVHTFLLNAKAKS